MPELGAISGAVRLDIRQAVAAYATLRAQNARTMYALRGTSDAFISSGKNMAIAGAGLLYVFGKAVSAAAEFERKMDFFSAVSDTSSKKMDQLSEYTLQLATDTIYSAEQIADGLIELGKSGVSAEQIMRGVGDAMANLGAAGDIPLAQSGQIITSIIQQYDLAARDAVEVTDLLAGAANASIADIDDLGTSFKYVGGVANAAGLSFEDTITAISLLAKAGIRGSTAGTSLRQMLVSLGGATGPATAVLEELGIITENGRNKFFTMEGQAKSLADVFQILQDHTADLTQKERLMALRTIFNNRALSAASILTREGAKGFEQMNKQMSKTTAAEVARERLDNLSGDMEILRGNIETLFIKAGTPFQDFMRGIVQNLTKLVQWFGNLDPKTQEAVFRFIGLAGAALVLMGAFNIIIGMVIRFVGFMIRMGAAIKFVWNILKLLRFAFIFVGGAIGTVGAIIIAAVLAIVAAFIIAYKHSERFREIVHAVGRALLEFGKDAIEVAKEVGKWFKLLYEDPGAAWEQLKQVTADAVRWIGDQLKKLPGLLVQLGGLMLRAAAWVGQQILAGLRALPGLIGQLMLLLGQVIWAGLQKLPGLAARALTALLTLVGRLLLKLVQIGMQQAGKLVQGIIGFIQKLPGRVGYIIGFMIGRALRLLGQLVVKGVNFGQRFVSGLIRFIQQLPGKVANFLTSMVTKAANLLVQMVTLAITKGPEILNGIVNAIQQLPGKVAQFFTGAYNKIIDISPQIAEAAINLGNIILNGIGDAIQGLPGLLGGILDEMIGIMKSMVSAAFNAVKDFASGLWEGFKDGIGMNSPSYLEEAMWQISGVMEEETKKLARMTMDVQKLSKTVGKTPIRLQDPEIPDYASVARKYNRMSSARRNLAVGITAGGGRPGAAVVARGPVTKTVEINQHITNPKPETPSNTMLRQTTRIAQLGLLDGKDDD